MERDDDLQLTIGELDLVCGGAWNLLTNMESPPTQSPPPSKLPTSGGHTGFGWNIAANMES